MKIFICTIGAGGDVQPILALGLELKALQHSVTICVAPNYGEWVKSPGLDFVPIGPDLKKYVSEKKPEIKSKPTKLQLNAMAAGRSATRSGSCPKRHRAMT